MLLHQGCFILKSKAILILAFPLSLLTWAVSVLTQWSLSNQEYVAGVLVCIAIDHIIGSFYHAFKAKDFSFKKNAVGLITKLTLCAFAGALFEIIHNVAKESDLAYEYLKIITRLVVILYPAGSAIMNMSALTNGVFPPLGWIEKIKAFNQTLDLDTLKNKKNGDV